MSKPRSPFFVDPLYSRMAEDLHLGGMSQRTHDGYLRAVRQLADYFKTPPDKISEDQLRLHYGHLIAAPRASPPRSGSARPGGPRSAG